MCAHGAVIYFSLFQGCTEKNTLCMNVDGEMYVWCLCVMNCNGVSIQNREFLCDMVVGQILLFHQCQLVV